MLLPSDVARVVLGRSEHSSTRSRPCFTLSLTGRSIHRVYFDSMYVLCATTTVCDMYLPAWCVGLLWPLTPCWFTVYSRLPAVGGLVIHQSDIHKRKPSFEGVCWAQHRGWSCSCLSICKYAVELFWNDETRLFTTCSTCKVFFADGWFSP